MVNQELLRGAAFWNDNNNNNSNNHGGGDETCTKLQKKNFKQQNLPNYNEEYCITVSYSKATNIQILKVYG